MTAPYLSAMGQAQQGWTQQSASNQFYIYQMSGTSATQITTASTGTAWYAMNTQSGQQGYLGSTPSRDITVGAGARVNLPDGAVIDIDDKGSYKINDKNAKVVYQANRVREFNPFINASDLLERFIADVGKIDGIDQSNVLRVPVEGFINWLIRQAAQKDGDKMDGLPTVEEALRLPAPMLALVAA